MMDQVDRRIVTSRYGVYSLRLRHRKVRYRDQSGPHLLNMSSSAFDPQQKSQSRGSAQKRPGLSRIRSDAPAGAGIPPPVSWIASGLPARSFTVRRPGVALLRGRLELRRESADGQDGGAPCQGASR
jgi:hypothetical protein